MDQAYVRNRITQLRIQKGVSEYKMSYDLGHSRGYINNISSGKTLPSMTEFLAICEYFGISPSDFFNESANDPALLARSAASLSLLEYEDLALVNSFIHRLIRK